MGNININVAEKLLKIKKDIEFHKEEKAKAEGRIQSYMELLKKEHDVNSIEEARELIAKLDIEYGRKNAIFEKELGELQGMMDA